jgi:hypothetical protein
MPEETLILKRDPNTVQSEGYIVLFEGRYVGSIYKAVSDAPRETPRFWASNSTSGRAAIGHSTGTSRI